MKTGKLEIELAALETLSPAQLRDKWAEVSDAPLPRLSTGLLRLALAWKMQATMYGGLSRRTSQSLDQIIAGKTETRSTEPGMRLMREWNGKLHVVTLDDHGAIHWDDRKWKSLSAVARAITGTRWSGPAFFGLRKRKAAA